MAEQPVSLDSVVAALQPALLEARFEDAGSGTSGPYTWVRFRRHERLGTQRCVRLITISHAPDAQAFLADAYLVMRSTNIYTPVGRERRHYGAAADAEVAARELASVVLSWAGA